MGDLVYKVMSVGAAIGAAKVARAATDGSWKFIRGQKSPENPADPDNEWKEAIAFAILSGAIVGLARMLASRQTAAVFAKSTGRLPKDLQKDT